MNFNIPDWESSKAGVKASAAFAKAGKSRARAKPTKPTKSPAGKRVQPASKAIKKASPVPVKKVKVKAAVTPKATPKGKQVASPLKSAKAVRTSARKTLSEGTPKVAKVATPVAKVTKISPKSPKTKTKVGKQTKVASVNIPARKSTLRVPVPVTNGVSESPKVQSNARKGRKHKLPQLETTATPAKVQKIVAPASPKKSTKPSQDKNPKTPKTPKTLKTPKVPKIFITKPTPKRPVPPVKRTSLTKKLATPTPAKKASPTPTKKASPTPRKKASPKVSPKASKPSKASKTPSKKPITMKVASPTKKKSMLRTKTSPASPTKPPTPKKVPKAPASPKSKKPSPKLNPQSVAIKMMPMKKKPTKSKIKIAGLLGKRKPLPPIVNGSPSPSTDLKSPGASTPGKRDQDKQRKKLSAVLTARVSGVPGSVTKRTPSKKNDNVSLRERMIDRLQSARFRFINETLYTKDSAGAVKLFKEDPDAFNAYHQGYRLQVAKWPMNPLTKIIAAIKKMPEKLVVADFGCGDATLAKSVKQRVHSFDLVAANDRVTACDMAHVPLEKHSVDVAVFCLSLMGTNLEDYVIEANRVLKVGGILMIAEVESRFDKVADFLTGLSRFGFNKVHQDYAHNMFYLWQLRKTRDANKKKNLPSMNLHPCLYKKR